ncbi:uncharacterized protein LOC134851453 isoform X2 [Symsagittifera roscoffensis]|uniref:uncharacterized protein LOC134851453 isoform X2 n=1 Tax=Symsagittifera roscoffensis TaxID=84072 RepID=UPI00307C0901
MVMLNEHSWNSLQSGLRRAKQDIEADRTNGGINSPKQVPVRSTRSPRLPRLSSTENESNHVQDLRRSKFNVVPPVHRSFSLESVTNGDRTQNQSVFTPPTYFNSHADQRRQNRQKRQHAVPNKSISSFLSQRKAQEAEWSQIFSEDEELYTRGGDSLNYNKRGQDPYKHQGKDSQLGMYKRRAMEDKRGAPNSNFNILDDDLAPTPESQVENRRHIRLRERERFDPRKRGSLEEFVDRLRNERRRDREERQYSPSLRYKPLNPNQYESYPSERDHGYEYMNGNMHGLKSPLPYEGDSAVMSIVDELVWDTLEEDMVPDVLIEVFMEAKDNPDLANKTLKDAESITASMEKFLPMKTGADPFQSQKRSLSPPSHHYPWISRPNLHPPLPPAVRSTEDPAIKAHDEMLFRRTFDQMVTVPMVAATQINEVETIAAEVVQETMPDIVREAIFDVILEDYIENDLLAEVIREESRDVTIETLKKLDSRVEWKQRRAVNSFAKDKLVDSFSLDHVLDLIAKSGRIYTDDMHREKILDDVILNQLLSQFLNVNNQLQSTVRNGPLRRLHEKIVCDVAVDVVLEELEAQLDEDMEDLHEYETSLDDPRMLEHSLKLAAASEALPDGLKEWIRSVDASFAPPNVQTSRSRSQLPPATNRMSNLERLDEEQTNSKNAAVPDDSISLPNHDNPLTVKSVTNNADEEDSWNWLIKLQQN